MKTINLFLTPSTNRTNLLADAKKLAESEVLDVLTKVKNGHKISGNSWKELGELFLDHQGKRVETNHITKGRLVTVHSQISKHIIPFIGAQKRLSKLAGTSVTHIENHYAHVGESVR